MSWWNALIGTRKSTPAQPSSKPNYLAEGIAHEQKGHFDEALTSYRLALRDVGNQNDPTVLQNIGITYMKAQRTDDAAKTFRRVLDASPHSFGAHYGLAFCLLRMGETQSALKHLDLFLAEAPVTAMLERHRAFAHETRHQITAVPNGAMAGSFASAY